MPNYINTSTHSAWRKAQSGSLPPKESTNKFYSALASLGDSMAGNKRLIIKQSKISTGMRMAGRGMR